MSCGREREYARPMQEARWKSKGKATGQGTGQKEAKKKSKTNFLLKKAVTL